MISLILMKYTRGSRASAKANGSYKMVLHEYNFRDLLGMFFLKLLMKYMSKIMKNGQKTICMHKQIILQEPNFGYVHAFGIKKITK